MEGEELMRDGCVDRGWVITTEVSTNTLREKTQALGSASNILFSWVVTFSLPYLTNDDEAGLGPKVGFIFAALVIGGGVYTFFCVPETSGRALEELDELFQKGVPSRKFKGTAFPSPFTWHS
jgi:MFS transporter, SP family, sugar:H+ symporter